MTKLLVYFLSIAFVCFAGSCKKQEKMPGLQPIDKTKSFLKEIRPDITSPYFISGEFDGNKLYFASTFADQFPSHDTGFNVLTTNSFLKLDYISLVRQNADKSAMIEVSFDQAMIFTRQLPYILPHANLATCEKGMIILKNIKLLQFPGEVDYANFAFFGHTNDAVKMRVEKFAGNIIEGSFEGSLVSNSGSTIVVKNGAFRLKIYILDSGK